jgi:hypothetical protein
VSADLTEAADLVEHLRDDDGQLTRGAWLVRSLVTELAERRTAPQLTAEEARTILTGVYSGAVEGFMISEEGWENIDRKLHVIAGDAWNKAKEGQA